MCKKMEIKNELKKYHINYTQEEILFEINEAPGITLCELTKKMHLSKGSVSLCLKKLEEEKLIQRYGTFDDKRVFKIHPTKMGKDLYSKIKFIKIVKI
ncbi:MarR family transcriptional regulator [Cetobacterium sp.]|uniref:MarR family transcriptional regulator n=1 Tax=Cetobacterium sp. TaxID=2071632 RepID=UPI003F3DE7BA